MRLFYAHADAEEICN